MKKTYGLIGLWTLIVFNTTFAQERLNIAWHDSPREMDVDDEEWSPYGAVFLYNYVKSDHGKVGVQKVHTKFVHRRVRLFNEEALDAFNTLKIPYTDKYKVSNIKARSIHKDGTVTDVRKNTIEEAMEEGVRFKLIAFENLDIGDDIEYSYEWNFPDSEYEEVQLFTGLSALSSYFEVALDENMDIDLQAYNGVDVFVDTTANRPILYAEVKNLKEDDEEQFSFPTSYSPRLEYKVTYPGDKDFQRTRSWDDYNPMKINDILKSTLVDKGVKKLLRDIPLGSSEQKNIFETENYLKKTYNIGPTEPDQIRSVRTLRTTQEWSENEFSAVLAALLYIQDIDFQIGFTTDRSEKVFDPTFVNSDNMEYMFFYFPKYKKYLMPTAVASRYSYIPSLLRGNQAILYSLNPKQNFNVHKIPALGSDQNYHNHDVKVMIDTKEEHVIVNSKQSMTGDTKANTLPYLILLNEETKDEFVASMVKFDESEDEMEKVMLRNNNWQSLYNNQPLIIETQVESEALMQKVADDEFLINVGAVIGRQAELPQRGHERLYDIDMATPHALMRKIAVKIPEGFKAVNMEDLEIDKSLVVDGQKLCYFKSSAKLEGNNIIIDIEESYEKDHMDKKYYEEFRDVINAAAEFNKLDILITKN